MGWVDEVDVLGAERSGGTNLDLDVVGDVLHLVGVDLQPQRDWFGATGVATLDPHHPPYLDTVHLDLGVALHHEPGPVGGDRHRQVVHPWRTAVEQHVAQPEHHRHDQHEDQRRPAGGKATSSVIQWISSRQVEVPGLAVNGE